RGVVAEHDDPIAERGDPAVVSDDPMLDGADEADLGCPQVGPPALALDAEARRDERRVGGEALTEDDDRVASDAPWPEEPRVEEPLGDRRALERQTCLPAPLRQEEGRRARGLVRLLRALEVFG